MKQFLFFLAIIISFAVQGQNNKPTKKILIGFNFSPDYNFRTLKNSNGESSADVTIKNRNDIETPKFGYTTGMNVGIIVSQRLGLETGIQYSDKGYKTKIQDLVYFPPSPSSPKKAHFIYAYQYVGIPFKAKFYFGKGNVRFLSSIGLMTNFLLNVKQTTIVEYSNGKTEKNTQSTTSSFKKVDISPIVSIGIDYKLNKKFHLLAEPTFRYGVIKTKSAPVTENLWNAGLNIGIYYEL